MKPMKEKRVVIAAVGSVVRGKSTIARHIAEQLNKSFGFEESLKVHSTDEVRNEFIKKKLIKSVSKGVNKGTFSSKDRKKVYDEVLSRIESDLKQRRVALVTGTYGYEEARRKLYELAKKFDAKVIFVECLTSNKKARDRAKAAKARGEDRFGSLVGPERYEELRKNPETKMLTESPLLVRIKKAGGSTTIEKASLREFEQNNAEYIPFMTSFNPELLPERTKMLVDRIMDLLAKSKKGRT